jgi:hypothetical protein
MKKIKTFTFLLVVILAIYLLIPKKIYVFYQNSIETKVLNIELFLDGKKIENKEVVYSYMFPKESSLLNSGFGFHTIKVKCNDLKLEKSVKVFTLFKNNVEFEFIGTIENGFDVIARDSWFSLVYE